MFEYLRLPVAGLMVCVLFGTAPVVGVNARTLGKPEGRIVLRVTGAVGCGNTEQGAAFDRKLLESVGNATLVTRTPWTDGETTFVGVRARRLLDTICARGTSVQAKAHNDYMVAIPMSDFREFDVLLATHMDGKALTLRDKGPVWIVYPAVDGKHTREQQNRMVWQLKELIVEP